SAQFSEDKGQLWQDRQLQYRQLYADLPAESRQLWQYHPGGRHHRVGESRSDLGDLQTVRCRRRSDPSSWQDQYQLRLLQSPELGHAIAAPAAEYLGL